jgi:phosphoribosyl 1,2-cyclic phosphodiesterase
VKVTVLGSGSRGNAVACTANDTTIILDAGFPLRTLKKRAVRSGLDVSRLAAVFLTHEHNDHACGATLLARFAGCPVYASRGTLGALPEREEVPVQTIAHLETLEIGPFEVTACRTMHDAVEPLAFAITGPDGEKTVLVYDLGRPTTPLRYLLRTADCLIIESNHDESMLRAGPYPPSVRRRIGGPEGHLSNRAAAELLVATCSASMETVVLAHVSEICNRKTLAEETAREALDRRGYDGRLLVAEQDTPLASFDVGRS